MSGSSGIAVEVAIDVPSSQAGPNTPPLTAAITTDKLNQELDNLGISGAEMLQAPVMVYEPVDGPSSTGALRYTTSSSAPDPESDPTTTSSRTPAPTMLQMSSGSWSSPDSGEGAEAAPDGIQKDVSDKQDSGPLIVVIAGVTGNFTTY